MKPLTEKRISMVRELEKAEGTFDPKEIWVRAWEIMLEDHLSGMEIKEE